MKGRKNERWREGKKREKSVREMESDERVRAVSLLVLSHRAKVPHTDRERGWELVRLRRAS